MREEKEGRLLQFVYEATHNFTCVTACYFAVWKLTTPCYHDAASSCCRGVRTTPREDRQFFLSVLERFVSRIHLLLHAYCMMDNHYHLVLETPDANLSKALRQLNDLWALAKRSKHPGHSCTCSNAQRTSAIND